MTSLTSTITTSTATAIITHSTVVITALPTATTTTAINPLTVVSGTAITVVTRIAVTASINTIAIITMVSAASPSPLLFLLLWLALVLRPALILPPALILSPALVLLPLLLLLLPLFRQGRRVRSSRVLQGGTIPPPAGWLSSGLLDQELSPKPYTLQNQDPEADGVLPGPQDYSSEGQGSPLETRLALGGWFMSLERIFPRWRGLPLRLTFQTFQPFVLPEHQARFTGRWLPSGSSLHRSDLLGARHEAGQSTSLLVKREGGPQFLERPQGRGKLGLGREGETGGFPWEKRGKQDMELKKENGSELEKAEHNPHLDLSSGATRLLRRRKGRAWRAAPGGNG